ncbi:MAG: PEGA domain-containing protein [Acidobacteriota bacterium]
MTRRLLAVSLVVFALLAAWPADALAQRGDGGGRGPVVVVAPQRMPTVVYPPWYGPFGGPYQYPYPYPYPYPYRGYGYDNSAQLRVQATPRETEVYVDGARAGIVDDYDGIFQRLHLLPGEHEITLYLQGFRSWSEHRYFAPSSDQRILHTMLQLAPGQPDEPRPLPPPPQDRRDPRDPPTPPQPRNPPPPDQPRNPPQPDRPPMPSPPDRPAPGRPENEPRNFGTLSVGIQPADAEVLVDGKKQSLAAGQDRLSLQLPEGVHRLVIQKAGFQTWETDLQIRRGRTLAFNVSLVK